MQPLTSPWAGVDAHKAGGGALEGGADAAGLCYCSAEGDPWSVSASALQPRQFLWKLARLTYTDVCLISTDKKTNERCVYYGAQLVASDSPIEIRQAAAVNFKNHVKYHWVRH